MANKLKDLQITKVDFVDAGANQRANIMLFKRDAPKGGETVNTKNPVKKFLSSIAKALGITEDEAQNGIVGIAKEGEPLSAKKWRRMESVKSWTKYGT